MRDGASHRCAVTDRGRLVRTRDRVRIRVERDERVLGAGRSAAETDARSAKAGSDVPAAGVVGVPVEHAVVTFDAPAVSAKNVTSDVPETLAEIDTVPGDGPR